MPATTGKRSAASPMSTLATARASAARSGGAPELLVVAAARVEADDEVGLADALRVRLHVRGQIGTAALLARLDEHDQTRMRRSCLLHRLDGREGAEGRVAVVLSAAPVEAIAAAHGDPRAQPLRPPRHLWLLVAVTVEKNGLRRRARHFHEDHGRASGQAHRLHREPLDGAPAAPLVDEGGRTVQVAVGPPLTIEGRRLGGDLDVAREGGENVLFPSALDEGQGLAGRQRARRRRAHGRSPYTPAPAVTTRLTGLPG